LNSNRLTSDGKTRLLVNTKRYRSSNKNLLSESSFPTKSTGNVQNYIDVLLEKKRDRYKLAANGSGCRYWCLTALKDFEDARLLPPGTRASADKWIQQLMQQYPVEMTQTVSGTFY
jgi:hypothetical protein